MFFENSESQMPCIFPLKLCLILICTGPLVQVNLTFHTLIIVEYVFYQYSHKDKEAKMLQFFNFTFQFKQNEDIQKLLKNQNKNTFLKS